MPGFGRWWRLITRRGEFTYLSSAPAVGFRWHGVDGYCRGVHPLIQVEVTIVANEDAPLGDRNAAMERLTALVREQADGIRAQLMRIDRHDPEAGVRLHSLWAAGQQCAQFLQRRAGVAVDDQPDGLRQSLLELEIAFNVLD